MHFCRPTDITYCSPEPDKQTMDKHKSFDNILEFKLKKLGNKTWLASFMNGNYTEYYSALAKEEETSYDEKGAVIYVVSVLFFFGLRGRPSLSSFSLMIISIITL